MKSNIYLRFVLGVLRHPTELIHRLRELRRIAAEPDLDRSVPMNDVVDVNIIPVPADDAALREALVRMYADNPSPYLHGPKTMEKFRECSSRGVRYFLFANNDGEYVCARSYDPRTGLLQNAVTDFNHRGKGYQVGAGFAVMKLLYDEGNREVKTTLMRSNSRMQRLMISRGWTIEDDKNNPDLLRGTLDLRKLFGQRVAA
jgi:hypothetical protein